MARAEERLNQLQAQPNASITGTALGQPSFIKYMSIDTHADAANFEATTNGLFQAGGASVAQQNQHQETDWSADS
ncbi:hypothetical protein BAUCODRAFT_149622 [Baudoinia panamericana UAMH 10762]|uniref:Uncharacterized protein n=1 Tax=Baudoinia panamericana (strain UAMH 10762) TaxID=717646 RepID=M2N616_BAUPA|nr:uncharacterized protein BAUCODRAFT_149622 [Baudoinia panamericana UAMH 10762]EMC94474.1 hypothetical protein BAUCODRAFT_149622 [Baudoinia panamericana UAMH 10762]